MFVKLTLSSGALQVVLGAALILIGAIVSGVEAQQSASSSQAQSILIRNTRRGVEIVDPRTGRQLANSSQEDSELDSPEIDERIVAGLIDWLDKKKKKKDKDKEKDKEKEKEKQPEPPKPQPVKPVKPEIHIHIHTNDKKNKKKHQHQQKHKSPHYSHYENYHVGHDDHDYNDKHFYGKHAWPLLGHHLNLGSFGHDHFGHSGEHDHHDGYESSRVDTKLRSPPTRTARTQTTQTSRRTGERSQKAQ